MPITKDELVINGVYITSGRQLRKITAIGDNKVHWLSAGANTASPWSYGHTKAAPTPIETFIDAVDRKLTDDEIVELVGDRAEPAAI